MPFIAKIKRDDPFCSEDTREIEGMCKRIAAASEFMSVAGWREDAGFRLFHFTTWAKARAMQHWIDRSGIAHRPMPKLGLSAEEIAEQRREARGASRRVPCATSCRPTGRPDIAATAI